MRGATAGGQEQCTPSRLLEKGRLRSARRVARLKLGLPAVEPQTGTGALLQPAASGPPPVDLARRIKVSTVLDQVSDADVQRLQGTVVRKTFSDYKADRGDTPRADVEPTADQLSAMKQLLDSDAPPWADFAVFSWFLLGVPNSTVCFYEK